MSAIENFGGNRFRTIVETASDGACLSTLAAAVKAAELVDTLASPGPFTVFAPSNAAFDKLPAGELDRLLQPENKRRLTSFVTGHILAGQLTVADIRERAEATAGQLVLRTVDGDTIQIEAIDERLQIVDSHGTHVVVTMSDLLQSNGVIHVTDSVLTPQAW